MEDYRRTLKKAGTILIAIGVADIALMVACMITRTNYSSSVNIFAVIAGVFLIRGSERTALWITRLCALAMVGMIVGVAIVLPISQPVALWMVEFRLHPLATFLILAVPVAEVPLLIWLYRVLRQPEVLRALDKEYYPTNPPRVWFGIGAALACAIVAGIYLFSGSDSAKRAVAEAQARYGTRYQYVVKQISWGSNGGHALLTAFDDDEIKTVAVDWE